MGALQIATTTNACGCARWLRWVGWRTEACQNHNQVADDRDNNQAGAQMRQAFAGPTVKQL